MAEFLRYQLPEWLPPLSPDEMLWTGKVIAPAVLRLHLLPEAKDQLLNIEGPHQSVGQILGAIWMEGIMDRLAQYPDEGVFYSMSHKLTTLPELKRRLTIHSSNGRTSGTLFMATGEGNSGHLWAWDWMHRYVDYPVGLFEPDQYFANNPDRRKPFLPLSIRLSIASHFGLYATVLEPRDKNEPEDIYYQRMFNLTGAIYSFATYDDPNWVQKTRRGAWANFTLIPDLDTPHTSDAAQKLMPDVD